MSIREQEQETYDAIYSTDRYGDFSPGERYAPIFQELSERGSSVLDAGCGTGKGALALKALGYRVDLCDFTTQGLTPEASRLPFSPVCLWNEDDLKPMRWRDYVYCCDVLEHIPPVFTMLVARNLLMVARRGVFFSIALQPDQFGVWVGKSLHQTIQSFVFWRDALQELGDVTEARDFHMVGIYMVEPRSRVRT
jgi:SAM-dependent methyltransferase